MFYVYFRVGPPPRNGGTIWTVDSRNREIRTAPDQIKRRFPVVSER